MHLRKVYSPPSDLFLSTVPDLPIMPLRCGAIKDHLITRECSLSTLHFNDGMRHLGTIYATHESFGETFFPNHTIFQYLCKCDFLSMQHM